MMQLYQHVAALFQDGASLAAICSWISKWQLFTSMLQLYQHVTAFVALSRSTMKIYVKQSVRNKIMRKHFSVILLNKIIAKFKVRFY
jgi:hypothetical protein